MSREGLVWTEEGVSLEFTGGLALVSLLDKVGGNRLYGERLACLQKAFDESQKEPEVRLVILRSVAGAPWCLGMDLEKLGHSLGHGGSSREAAVAAYSRVLTTISDCPKPVVALLGGPVMAGGVGLAAACDIVLASPAASLELSEVYYGLIPANVMPHLLARRISMQKLKYLVLTAKKVSATEGLALGLVDELLPDEGTDDAVKRSLRNLFRGEPAALAATKRFCHELESMDRSSGLAHSQKAILGLMAGEPVGHALAALKNGESPRWFGRLKTDRPLFYAQV